MKFFLKTFFLLILSGCTSVDLGNKIAPGYVEAFVSIQRAIFGYESEIISKELIYEIPYASMVTKIGKGPNGLMILESLKNQEQLWISADNVYFKIIKGRIVATSGLENNLTNLVISKEISNYHLIDEGLTYKHYFSYDDPEVFFLEVEATYKKLGLELVNLFDRSIELELVEEELNNKYLGWKVINRYWIDSEGYIWKSEQNISPKLQS